MDWNLVLISSSPDGAERVLRFLEGAVGACGGWVLSRGSSGDECAEIDFEFARANCVEIYSVLVATGINLSLEAHTQLTELCHCTKYLLESKSLDIVRMHLTIYTQAASAWESGKEEKAAREAA